MGEHERTSALPAWRGWGPLLVLPATALLLTPAGGPRWVYMWVLCAALFASVKWLTWRRTPAPHASLGRHLGYFLAWPGLDAKAFLRGARPHPPTAAEWLDAAAKLVAGIVILWGVLRFVPEEDELVCGWVGMIGVVLALHFGA